MEKQNNFKLKNLSPIFWLIISLLMIMAVSSLSSLGEFFVNPTDDLKTKNTAEIVFLSICLFFIVLFLLIIRNKLWNVGKFIIILLVSFALFLSFYLLFLIFIIEYNFALFFCVLLLEASILYIYSVEKYKVQLFLNDNKVNFSKKINIRFMGTTKINVSLFNIVLYLISAFFISIFVGFWFKIPNSNLINRMLLMDSEWRKELILQEANNESFLLGDDFEFNYRYAFITFLFVFIIYYIIIKTNSIFKKINTKH